VSLLPLILTIAGFEVIRRVLPRDAAMVPKRVIITLGVMVVVILVVTALLMISWIKSSILDPINQLKTAMSRIRDGNLDYRLTTEEKGEIRVTVSAEGMEDASVLIHAE
jgi:nitrate/nitrite-specific signal transduction histidine kinase